MPELQYSNQTEEMASSYKCERCEHLKIKPHTEWGKSYTCKKNWYGGCDKPSNYSIRLCSQTKDFKLKK